MVAIVGTALHWSDILVLLLYFVVILGFGIWVDTNGGFSGRIHDSFVLEFMQESWQRR
jgi:hypothetical protein